MADDCSVELEMALLNEEDQLLWPLKKRESY